MILTYTFECDGCPATDALQTYAVGTAVLDDVWTDFRIALKKGLA
jgi:hypothetical protein